MSSDLSPELNRLIAGCHCWLVQQCCLAAFTLPLEPCAELPAATVWQKTHC